MRRVGVEDDDINTCRGISGKIFARHCPGWTRRERNEWKPLKGVVAGVGIFVPNRIKHLVPLVGTKNDDLVALGDISDETVWSRDHANASVAARDGSQFCDPIIDGREPGVVLAQRAGGNCEIDAIEAELCDCGFR
jgi:hypothetical protein